MGMRYKRGGIWYYGVKVNGQWVRRSSRSSSAQAAIRLQDEDRLKVAAGMPLDGEATPEGTFAEFATRYLEWKQGNGRDTDREEDWAGVGQGRAEAIFVAGRHHRPGAVVDQPQGLAGHGCQHRGAVVDPENSAERVSAGEGGDLRRALVEVGEIHGDRAPGSVLLEHRRLVGAHHHVDIEAPGGGEKIADPV